MQTLIASLILILAAVYLAWRWMPKSGQKSIGGWISQRAPALSPYLATPSGGCSGGCSSCGSSNSDNTGCSTETMPKINRQGHPVIMLRREQ